MDAKMKILIGYDGSECADSALSDLRRAGLPREGEAKILSVGEMWLPTPSRNLAENDEPKADLEGVRMLAAQAGKKIETMFPDWEVSSSACVGSPSREILEKADEWRPDLIVAGSHGRNALGRIVFGSVSQKVAAEAHCSVRIAREHVGKAREDPQRIIIAVDGSAGSHAAVNAVASRKWFKGSEVKLVTSVGVSPSLGFPHSMLHRVKLEGRQAENYMQEIRHALHGPIEAELQAAGLTVTSLVKEGDPKRVIIEEAEYWGADSIFVGSRGLGQLKRFLLGSISTAVVARSHCSVEVVRAKETVAQ